ncbi:hypothetical protein VNO77_28342 [Canavalia gladiata]|uniref:Bulb-type lectin domain-containing protein n=1 Tax=Canavalia gladiata TaxID=3824 RepID=A0AAN9KX45_CANGL
MQGMESFPFSEVSFYLVFVTSKIMGATDTISELQSLSGNQTLVSKNGNFELGFFTPGNSMNYYLGIWYKDIPVQTVVWVANRETSSKSTSSLVLHINTTTKSILLLGHNKTVIWCAIPSRKAQNPVLQLLDSGNLVLKEQYHDEDPKQYLWQSFDYPCDTQLPGMKIGKDLRTGFDRSLRAWKDENDPSPGNMTRGIYLTNWPEPMVWVGSNKYFSNGPWNGVQHSGKPTFKPHPYFVFIFSSN